MNLVTTSIFRLLYNENRNSQTSVQEFVLNLAQKKHLQFAKSIELNILQIHLTTEGV